MSTKEKQRRIWLLGNPTIGISELSANLQIHENTAYKMMAKSKEDLRYKRIQIRSVLPEFLIQIKLTPSSSIKEITEDITSAFETKYCTHNEDPFRCGCALVIQGTFGEVLILGVDYLMNSHKLLLRVVLTDTDVQKELIELVEEFFDCEISIDTIQSLY